MTAFLKRLDSGWIILAVIIALVGLYLAAIFPWMNRWGTSAAEINMVLPGDGVEPDKVINSTRAITIDAPAEEVWRWVVQIGQDQAGFYSNDWLENLVFSDIHNQDTIRPEWQAHQQGEPIYGAGGAVYRRGQFWPTQAYETGVMLYLWGPIVVLPVDGHTTRLFLRSYAGPVSWVTQFSYDWMHFVMERGMLLGIKARAEGLLHPGPLDALARLGWVASSLAMGWFLFTRRRGWGWGLIPLAYAAAIFIFTRDAWSAMAGFLWWGVIAAGFLAFGRAWWKRLALAAALVLSILVLFPAAHTIFGIGFLAITLGCFALRAAQRAQKPKIQAWQGA